MKWQRVLLVCEKEHESNTRLFEGFIELEDDKALRNLLLEKGLKEEFSKFFTEI